MKHSKGLWAAILVTGCAAGAGDSEGTAAGTGGEGGAGGAGAGGAATSTSTTSTGAGASGGGFESGTGGGNFEGTPEVFGHSKSTLYKLNPETKAVGLVADFTGCPPVTDIALDATSGLFAATDTGLYKVDKVTAACTLLKDGTYPNSLSFVPKGTLDPNEEALVGFVADQYVRIDTQSGAITNVGAPWNNNFISSGDVVSVKDGPTYLTIKDKDPNTSQCRDCLVQIDPATGAIQKSFPALSYAKVFGAAFWAGSVYGFTNDGKIFEIVVNGNQLTTTPIDTPMGLSFWGAGSTTSAPPTPQ
jgi:hypothetical protein